MVLLQKRREKATFEVKPEILTDIGILSNATGFSVDEIVNEALKQVIMDNKVSFINLAVYEHFMYQIEDAKEEFEPFEMGGLYVDVKYNSDDMPVVHSYIKDEGGAVVDDFEKTFPNEFDDFEKWLKELGMYIDISSEDSQNYIIARTAHKEVYYK